MASLLLSALLLCAWDAHARIVPLGPQFQVPTDPAGEHQCPQVVALPDGGFVVVWSGTPGEGSPTIGTPAFGRHFDAAGKAVGPQFDLKGIVGPQDVAAGEGGLVLSWFGDPYLVLGDFTPDGVSGAVQPVQASMHVFDGPALATTPQTDVILLWSELLWSEFLGIEQMILGQRFTADLQPTGPSFVVTSSGPDNAFPERPAIASRSDGGFVAVWVDDGRGGAVSGRQFDAMNEPLGEPFAVVEPGQLSDLTGEGPQVCVDDSGDFVAAWSDVDHPFQFRRYSAQAEPLTVALNTALGSAPFSGACLPQHSFVVIGFAAPGHSIEMVSRAFDEKNRPVGQFVIPVSEIACGPTVAALRDNTFVATWDRCADGYGKGCDVFAQRFELAPGAECAGDCNGDGAVTIDELLAAVDIALNDDPNDPATCLATQACPAADADLNCHVTIDDILAAVNRALEGCE